MDRLSQRGQRPQSAPHCSATEHQRDRPPSSVDSRNRHRNRHDLTHPSKIEKAPHFRQPLHRVCAAFFTLRRSQGFSVRLLTLCESFIYIKTRFVGLTQQLNDFSQAATARNRPKSRKFVVRMQILIDIRRLAASGLGGSQYSTIRSKIPIFFTADTVLLARHALQLPRQNWRKCCWWDHRRAR